MSDIIKYFGSLAKAINCASERAFPPAVLRNYDVMDVLQELPLGNVRFVNAGQSALVLETEDNPYSFPTVIRISCDDMPRFQWPFVLPALEAVSFDNEKGKFKTIERLPLLMFANDDGFERIDWNYQLFVQNFTWLARRSLANAFNDNRWIEDDDLVENFNQYNVGFAKANDRLIIPFLCETGNYFITDQQNQYCFGARPNSVISSIFQNREFEKFGCDPKTGELWSDVLFSRERKPDAGLSLNDFSL